MNVMSNLISNSLDATSQGSITIFARKENEFISVSVIDTGSGIPKELQEKVMERGVSGKNSTGLGLYICKTIIQAHGGTFKIDSIEQKGTTATFTIPIYAGQEEGHSI